jgi:hypothetical protein
MLIGYNQRVRGVNFRPKKWHFLSYRRFLKTKKTVKIEYKYENNYGSIYSRNLKPNAFDVVFHPLQLCSRNKIFSSKSNIQNFNSKIQNQIFEKKRILDFNFSNAKNAGHVFIGLVCKF